MQDGALAANRVDLQNAKKVDTGRGSLPSG
jgi:hypothetical protein